VTLLLRTTRSLRVTERGGLYLESCQRILEDIDGIERKVRGENAEPHGNLKVAAPVVFGRLHVLPIVNRVLREHRAVLVQLTLSDRNIYLVEEGVDVAVRIGELADSSFISVKLGVVSRVLVASPSYLKEQGVPKSPADLGDHDIIAFEGISATNEWRFSTGTKLVRVAPRLTVNNADAAIAAAEAAVGITRTLSYQVRASVEAGRLIPILQKFAPAPSPVNAIYPARRIASANIAVFVKAARDYFKAHPLVPVEEWRLRGRS
jgi:DNA-binding transcriptional LysR family regulator